MLQAVFYNAGEVLSDDLKLTSDNPGLIILKMEGQKLSGITVADPNRELSKMHFSVSMKIEKEGKNFKAAWNEKEKVTNIVIDLPKDNYAGDSVTIEF